MMADSINSSHLLLVEGKDEVLLVRALLRHRELGEDPQIMDVGGAKNFRTRIKAIPKTPGYFKVKSIGIMRDAEDSKEATFQSIRDALNAAGIPAPQQCNQSVMGPPAVFILIIPPDEEAGMLETLCMKSVATDPATPCVDQLFQCVSGQGLTLPKNIHKARTHAFLATRKEPDKRLGEGAEAGYWDLDSEVFSPIRDFISKVCTCE